MMTGRIVFLDTETTALHRKREVWEVALIIRDPTRADREIVMQHKWISARRADPKALEIGRYYERFDRDTAEDSWDIAKVVQDETTNATLVGANPAFDAYGLESLLLFEDLLPRWHYRLMDVESIVAGHLRRPVGGLRNCADAMGIAFDKSAEHTALGDARVVRDIWDAVMR